MCIRDSAKATELGVSHFHPMITQYTMAERAKIERWQRIAVEAAEQSQRLNIPQMDEPVPLATCLLYTSRCV